MQSVYVETTIPSYYFDTRREAAIAAWRDVTRRWWKLSGRFYRLYTSSYVFAELSLAPGRKAAEARRLLTNARLLEEPPGFHDVVQYYIEHLLMPADAEGDAAHLAMASMHNMEFLLTWNCRHLANANKIQHLRVLNGRLGLHVPVITTPLTLMPEQSP